MFGLFAQNDIADNYMSVPGTRKRELNVVSKQDVASLMTCESKLCSYLQRTDLPRHTIFGCGPKVFAKDTCVWRSVFPKHSIAEHMCGTNCDQNRCWRTA